MLACLLCLALPAAAVAQASGSVSSASGSATATVAQPLSVTTLADLDFGTIATSAQGGTVIVRPMVAGAEFGGGVQAICAAACLPPHPARFGIRGEAGRSYSVTVPETMLVIPQAAASQTGGAPTPMMIDTLNVATANSPQGAARGLLDAQGADFFEVGGTLHVGPNQAEARYVAQIIVSVEYF